MIVDNNRLANDHITFDLTVIDSFQETPMSIYIGTCGFAYPEWDGLFYPPAIPARDRLIYYADRFGAVELDSFFYHLPQPEMVQKMVRRTRKEFRFTVKLHRSITHEF